MYYPYFRGKQYELITIRECADVMSGAGFTPIIEPVKENLNGLHKAIDAILEANGNAVLITNPRHGHHAENAAPIESLFNNELSDAQNISAGILLTKNITIDQVIDSCRSYQNREIYLIHSSFNDAKGLALALNNLDNDNIKHIFLDGFGTLYRRHFEQYQRILVHDGFVKRKNKDHPELEIFSELHVTFPDKGMNGFGDFLIVGDDYSVTGGPAYAIAIHITYIDYDDEDIMYLHHFLSDRQDTPTDPAGKFGEALRKMVTEVENADGKLLRTEAVNEFIHLHEVGHFPGLGYVKKLSMKHHIEVMIDYFGRD